MKMQVSLHVNIGSNDFEGLVYNLHDDYQFHRKHGYKGTPYEYVKNAVLTFPSIQRMFTYENIGKMIAKISTDNTNIVNSVNETTHLFNIILAINNICTYGIKLMFSVGDIVANKKSGGVFIIRGVDTKSMTYNTITTTGKSCLDYDTEFIETNFIKIGRVDNSGGI